MASQKNNSGFSAIKHKDVKRVATVYSALSPGFTDAGAIVAQGGPYPKTLANKWVLDTLCLPQGCYNFQINDSYNDGICCDFGNGSYTLIDNQLNVLSQGGSFTNMEQSSFCVPFAPNTGGDCQSINFSNEEVVSYGTNQDRGQYAVQDDGQTLYLANNAWKAIMMDYGMHMIVVSILTCHKTRQ